MGDILRQPKGDEALQLVGKVWPFQQVLVEAAPETSVGGIDLA